MRALVCDHGLFVELALRLARELGDTVGYYSEWQSTFPMPNDQLIGSGFESDGVERVDFPLELVGSSEEPEIWIFPDLYYTDTQTLLRKLKRNVWGSGWGELLELDRWKMHQLLEDNALPAATSERVEGLNNVIRQLKNASDKLYVKLAPYYRGLSETYESRGWPASRSKMDELALKLGPRADTMGFMLQAPVEGDEVVEPGLDLIVRDGQILYPTLIGYEKKSQALISKVIPDIPDILKGPVEVVVKALSEQGNTYTNFFSAELRVNEYHDAYFIDATCRMPRPGDGVHQELCENLAEVMLAGGRPRMSAMYACQLMLDSPQLSDKRPLHIEFPPECRDNVKLYQCYRDKDGEYWVLPRSVPNDVVSVVTTGDDLDQVIKECLDIAEEVKFDEVTYDRNAFDEICQDIERGRQNGVDF